MGDKTNSNAKPNQSGIAAFFGPSIQLIKERTTEAANNFKEDLKSGALTKAGQYFALGLSGVMDYASPRMETAAQEVTELTASILHGDKSPEVLAQTPRDIIFNSVNKSGKVLRGIGALLLSGAASALGWVTALFATRLSQNSTQTPVLDGTRKSFTKFWALLFGSVAAEPPMSPISPKAA